MFDFKLLGVNAATWTVPTLLPKFQCPASALPTQLKLLLFGVVMRHILTTLRLIANMGF